MEANEKWRLDDRIAGSNTFQSVLLTPTRKKLSHSDHRRVQSYTYCFCVDCVTVEAARAN